MAADRERVWRALHELRWDDLSVTRALMWVRMGGRSPLHGLRLVDPPSPAAPVDCDPPRWVSSARIGRPWRVRPAPGPPVTSLAELAAFNEPGWLKYGMQWQLQALPDGRTRVTTSTVCEATDAAAQRRFRVYWTLIRTFSGLVRRDMLRALERATRD